MKIAIIADPCDPNKPGGLGRCIFELAKSLIEAAPEHSYTVYSKSEFPVRGIEKLPLRKNVWLFGARDIDSASDVHIFFTPVIPLFFKPKHAIVAAEDFAYLELPRHTFREQMLGLVTYVMHRRSLRMAEKIVCISEATKECAIRFFGVDPKKCVIVPLAAMPLTASLKEVDALPARFFFFAGVLKDRKNVLNIVKAFALFAKNNSDMALVIAGKKEGAYYESLLALVREEDIEDRVRFLGHMNDAQMAYLYSRAEALVFVSKVEGFGMPLIEAMRAGVPVITSDRGALAEVAADAALLCNPDSPEEIAAAMQRLSADANLRASLTEKGLRRAKDFSWEENGLLFARALPINI